MFYFLVLAFIFIPNQTEVIGAFAASHRQIYLNFSTASNGTIQSATALHSDIFNITTKSSEMVKLWMYDKRFKNQISAMVPIPLSLSLFVPMIFEYLLPKLCVSWRRKTRISAQSKKRKKSCLCCCNLCTRCRCCVVTCNCLMCDEDAQSAGRIREACLDIDDDALIDLLNNDRKKMFVKNESKKDHLKTAISCYE